MPLTFLPSLISLYSLRKMTFFCLVHDYILVTSPNVNSWLWTSSKHQCSQASTIYDLVLSLWCSLVGLYFWFPQFPIDSRGFREVGRISLDYVEYEWHQSCSILDTLIYTYQPMITPGQPPAYLGKTGFLVWEWFSWEGYNPHSKQLGEGYTYWPSREDLHLLHLSYFTFLFVT